MPVVGEAADHLVAFDRGGAVSLAARLPVALERRGGWGDTEVALPGRPMTDVITGRRFAGGLLRVADLLDVYPVALLAPTES
jgi:(1->4)-alpha-D-glucan 1-alpha-D-glucosylmutase